jgi:hypothetical protein
VPDTRTTSYVQDSLLRSIWRLGVEELGKGSKVILFTLGELDSVVLGIESSEFSLICHQLRVTIPTYRQEAMGQG